MAIKIQSFVGLVKYYRQFVQGFSTIATLLTRLIKKNIAFYCLDKCEAIFQKRKVLLTLASILTMLEKDVDFTIYYGASRVEIGAILIQKGKVITTNLGN